jgi:hypothetical protein
MTTAEDVGKELDAVKAALSRHRISARELDSIASEVARLRERVEGEPRKRRRITELKGLGKDYWRSIDVEDYLRRERDSWD